MATIEATAGVTVLGRKRDDVTAVERRRLARRYKATVSQQRRLPPAQATLTPKQLYVLHKATKPLFDSGAVGLRYMGLRFLELYALGWTPVKGLKCTEPEFVGVWDWWAQLEGEDRLELMELSRQVGMDLIGVKA